MEFNTTMNFFFVRCLGKVDFFSSSSLVINTSFFCDINLTIKIKSKLVSLYVMSFNWEN